MTQNQRTEVEEFDAIVIGSGVTGGMAAKELTEKGLRVLMLERNPPLDARDGYRGEQAPPWVVPFGGLPDRERLAKDYPVQSQCYAFDEMTRTHFLKDTHEPYTEVGDTKFRWYRGGRFGGRSITWGRQVYRWGPHNFEENALDGHGVDWPIRYQDLAPWYSHVEKFIGVAGQAEGLETFPDMEFQKPMDMYPIEKRIQKRLARHAPDITFTIGRTAILTEPKGLREACHYCGHCARGCATGSYFSTQSSTLPAALETGRLTIASDTAVQKILYNGETNRATGVQTVNTQTRQQRTYRGRIIFLCASAINSAQILLNSRNEYFPNGLANSSDVVGRYMMDHNAQIAGIGLFTDDLDRYFEGKRANGCYIPRFRNMNGASSRGETYKRGFGIQVNTTRLDQRFLMHQRGFGARFKDEIRKPGPWVVVLSSFGEVLPRRENGISLDHTARDHFGMPKVEINMTLGTNEYAMLKDMEIQSKRILRAAGAVLMINETDPDAPINAIHEMGTVRMGKDKTTSALNGWNQSHDIPNLYVTDGAAMASSADVNPSLTYLALTARAADHAAKLWKKGEL